MDELLPKATGHQARIEKRRAINQHRKEREISPGKYKSIRVLLYWPLLGVYPFLLTNVRGY